MVNTALNFYRANLKHFYHKDVDDYAELIPGQSNFQKKMYADDILKVIQQMPAGYRTVFNMFEIEGYSHKEIAKKLGITENTSKTQLLKARKLLRKMFADYEK
jgi:RNA polymerase sigma-70 factor (ECF subfamily)